MDELSALESIYKSQKRWRLTSLVVFILTVVFSSVVFIVFPRSVSGILVQFLMILSMFSILGLVFLDRVSFQLNKKFFKKDILSEYLFKHSKPEDVHKDPDIMVELIKTRRAAAQEKKKYSAKI